MIVANLIAANTRRWAAMRFTTSRIPEIDATARKLIAPRAKARYQRISQRVWGTEKWWGVVAVVHLREGGGSFNTYLGNGQLLSRVTTLVPRGRGPFLNHPNDPPGEDAFYRGALDALIDVQHAPQWVALHGDSIGSMLTFVESLNGFGYANKGLPSSYLWGASNQQVRGKYIADGVWSSTVWDTQLGCAALLRYMTGLDPSVGFGDPHTLPIVVSPPIVPEPVPVPTPAPGDKPVTTPTPGTAVVPAAPTHTVTLDLGALINQAITSIAPKLLPAVLPQLLPALPGIVTGLVPGLAPIEPLIEAGANVVQVALGQGGLQTVTAKLIVDEVYKVCVKVDPTLPHTT